MGTRAPETFKLTKIGKYPNVLSISITAGMGVVWLAVVPFWGHEGLWING